MTTFVPNAELTRFGTGPVPVEAYSSPDYFARERDAIFRRVWLWAGRDSDIPNPGDYFVKDIPSCDASVIVVRGKDGFIRAFHNVCSHRHARLASETSGNTVRFACPYHGWSYNLNGELRGVPDEQNFLGLDKSRCDLTKVSVDVFASLIFINLDPNPAQDLKTYLDGAADSIGSHALPSWTAAYRFQVDIPANWKCVLDNFQEVYHLNYTHFQSLHDRSSGPANPMGHPLDFAFFGPHRRFGVWGNPEHKLSPVEGVAATSGMLLSHGASLAARERKPRHPNWQMDAHCMFPNIMVDITGSFFLIHEVMPITHEHSRLTSTIWFPEAGSASQRFGQEYTAAAFRDTIAEDAGILSTVQAGMRSGAKKEIHFHSIEITCRHLYETVEAYLAGGRAAKEHHAQH